MITDLRVGLIVNFSLVFLSVKLSRNLKKVEKERTLLSDKRIQNLTQLIEGIKAVKYYAWEEPSTDKIAKIRAEECVMIGKYRQAQALAVQIGRASPPLAACAALVVYSYVHEEFTAENAFVTVAIFQALRPISIMLPTSFVCLLRGMYVSSKSFALFWEFIYDICLPRSRYVMSLGNAFRRIQDFLSEENHPERQTVGADEDVVAELSMCDLQWRQPDDDEEGENKMDLKGVSVQVKRGTVTAVVGAVGSGKSTFCSAAVGELVPLVGSVRSAGTIGYVQQKSFIISDSIKNNVLFGREYDETRFSAALEASEFTTDLAQLVDGLQTIVGERGATLSGGQQQRLSIARAIYGTPELLVLDDPLSALDSTVGEAIFIKAIRAFADADGSKHAVLMATNQLHILSRCDHIVVLEDGAVRAQGSYAELQQDPDIAAFLQMREDASIDDAGDAMDQEAAESNGSIKQPAAAAATAETQQKPAAEKTRKAEAMATGAVSGSVYTQYAKSLGPNWVGSWCFGLGLTYACTVG